MSDLTLVFDALREGIQVIDRGWRYRYLNPAAAAHGKRSPEELLGRTMMECYPGIERTETFQVFRRSMDTGTHESVQSELAYPDGTKHTFELRIQPCDTGIVVLSIDVTDRCRLQEQLLHAQKLEAVGRLAGGVAHDFNNFLSVILSSATFIEEALPAGHEALPDVEAIRDAGDRAAVLTRQLLAFSRRQVSDPKILDLNAIVVGMDKMLRRILGEDIALVTLPSADLWKTKIDGGHVEQLIANLVINSRDAMPRGGNLTIDTKNVVLDAEYERQHADVTAGEFVMLAVSDTGEGMDAATRARIFEPFFTTKAQGRGTGLGLATCYGIVKQAGGSIWVHSEPGKGTTFKIYLPRAKGEATAQRASAGPAAARGIETILLVEDEAAVRAAAVRTLERLGYTVLEAATPDDALRLAAEPGATIQMLLSDVVLPGMGGRDLADRIASLHPSVRVVFMSGYTADAIVRHGVVDEGNAFLQKPFAPDALGNKVREVLDERRVEVEGPRDPA